MIAVCTNPKCQLIFDSPGISISGIANVRINNNVTKCPKCKSLSRYLDGTFSFDKSGIATLLSGPQFTVDILTQLKELTENALKDSYSTEEYLEKTKVLNPALEFLKKFIPSDGKEFRNYFYTLLIGLLVAAINNSNADNKKIINNNYRNTYYLNKEKSAKTFLPKVRKPNHRKLRIIKNNMR